MNHEKELIDTLELSGQLSYEGHEMGVEEDLDQGSDYDIVPNPKAEAVDLSKLRGVGSGDNNKNPDNNSDTELENLAELVPDVKHRRKLSADAGAEQIPDDVDELLLEIEAAERAKGGRKLSMQSGSTGARRPSHHSVTEFLKRNESMKAQESRDMDDLSRAVAGPLASGMHGYPAENESSSEERKFGDIGLGVEDYPDSDLAIEESEGQEMPEDKMPKEFLNSSSAQSISTATQTHEVRMPMYLPTFKPATGCTNASDFVVRCFVARLRSGITVVKHGRSRWCKSRLRVLHIHPDGRSLSWKPAEGEPVTTRRPPKLDLSTCLEVRHAWSPDPQNPMYTGTPILRQKCEAANAHKSFALIFKSRTVDITAVTADQCKVLMEGFSALCFRLQVANIAGRGAKKTHSRPMPEEDGVSTTASATLTNTSTPRAR